MKKILSFALAYGAYVAFLNLVPGPWRTWKQDHEGKATDPWTIQHVIWGGIANRWGISRGELLLLGMLNEGAELATRKLRPDLLWGTPETPPNVGVDLLASAVGWQLADLVKK